MALLPTISSEQLRRFRQDDELRVTHEGGEDELTARQGNWLNRAVRWIIAPFRGADPNVKFVEAKSVVLDALKREFGEEIGTKVFRANVGHMIDGEHRTSSINPITGRHVQKMVEQGEREILRKYGRPENGGVQFDGEWSMPDGGPIPGVPEPATRDWMLRKSCGLDGPSRDDPPNLDPVKRFDRRDMDLRVSEVPFFRREGLTYWEGLAQALFDDFDKRVDSPDSERGLFWTLDLRLDQGAPLPSTHSMGVRIDPEEPGVVNVFDVNHCEVKVPREEFSAWLGAHIAANYPDVGGVRLFRAEETMKDRHFAKVDGTWKAQFDFNLDGESLGDILKKNIGHSKPDISEGVMVREAMVSPSFSKDLERMSIEIISPARTYGLTTDNYREGFSTLLGNGTETEDQHAIYNLSLLLCQNLGNAPYDLVGPEIAQRMGVGMMMPGGGGMRIVVTKNEGDDEPVIGIKVEMVRGCYALNGEIIDYSSDLLAPSSQTNTSYRLEIPLSSLREENGWEDVRVVGEVPTKVDLEAFVGVAPESPNAPRGISFYTEENRLVSERLTSNTRLNELLRTSGDDKPTTPVDGMTLNEEFVQCVEMDHSHIRRGQLDGDHDAFSGSTDIANFAALGEQGRLNLSHLLAPSTGMGIYRDMMQVALDDPNFTVDPESPPHWRVTTTPSEDGQTLDIEYRFEIPEGTLENAPGVALYYGSPRQEPGHFETIVKIRVPVETLNERLPENYDVMIPGRIEWRGNDD